MEIRRAEPAELELLLDLYDRGRRFMRRSGNPNQWINGYPDRALIQEDIRLGRSYLALEGGAPAGAFCFFYGERVEPSYGEIDGAWLDDGPYGVMHRVVSSGRVPGLVAACAAWCLDRCPSLRIDTHRDNAPMRRALERCGFRYCGVIVIDDGSQRLAYQKLRESAKT